MASNLYEAMRQRLDAVELTHRRTLDEKDVDSTERYRSRSILLVLPELRQVVDEQEKDGAGNATQS